MLALVPGLSLPLEPEARVRTVQYLVALADKYPPGSHN